MARIRSVKPELCTMEQFIECSRDARLLFILLGPFCDDGGVHPASLKVIKASVFPADEDVTAEVLARWMDELMFNRLIARFEVGGQQFIYVPDWKQLQRIEKPQPLRFPQPSDPAAVPVRALFGGGVLPEGFGKVAEPVREHYGSTTEALPPEGREGRKGREEEGEDGKKESPCSPPRGDASPDGEGTGPDLLGDDTALKSRPTRGKGVARGTRVPDGELPEEWAAAANHSRERHLMPLLGRRVLALRWESFQNYWRGLSGAKALKRDWQATWLNDCISPHTERKFPPDCAPPQQRAAMIDTTG